MSRVCVATAEERKGRSRDVRGGRGFGDKGKTAAHVMEIPRQSMHVVL